jgi:(1->4)-alpha-D-glucan 1-alpha-D-glucosylmutase
LTLRAHRPDAFTGDYTPLAAGGDAVAFLRGDSVLAATGLRGEPAASVDVPAGTWRDALAGGERRLSGPVPLSDLLGEHGIALLERTG